MKSKRITMFTVITRTIEFSLASHGPSWWKEFAKKLCEKNPGLSVNPNYSHNNGGVCYGLEFTGPEWLLTRIEKKYGYGY